MHNSSYGRASGLSNQPPAEPVSPGAVISKLIEDSLGRKVGDLISVLDEKEQAVLSLRYGLGETLQSVGRRYGVGRERIRQIQNFALLKLRRALLIQEGHEGIPHPNGHDSDSACGSSPQCPP